MLVVFTKTPCQTLNTTVGRSPFLHTFAKRFPSRCDTHEYRADKYALRTERVHHALAAGPNQVSCRVMPLYSVSHCRPLLSRSCTHLRPNTSNCHHTNTSTTTHSSAYTVRRTKLAWASRGKPSSAAGLKARTGNSSAQNNSNFSWSHHVERVSSVREFVYLPSKSGPALCRSLPI